jgi:hypothetical protein
MDPVSRGLRGQAIPAGTTCRTLTVSILGHTVRELIGEHFQGNIRRRHRDGRPGKRHDPRRRGTDPSLMAFRKKGGPKPARDRTGP